MDSFKKLNFVAIIVLALIIIASVSWFCIIPEFGSLENAAKYGDAFNILSTIFSGLAFGGLLYTILLQRKEIKAQEIESVTLRANQNKMISNLEIQAKSLEVSSKISGLTASLDYQLTILRTIDRKENPNGFMVHDREAQRTRSLIFNLLDEYNKPNQE